MQMYTITIRMDVQVLELPNDMANAQGYYQTSQSFV
jgi:hypothetical protein